MKIEKKGIEQTSLLLPDTQINTSQIIRLENIGLSMPHDRYAPSGSAILMQATEPLLSASRRDGGFWHQIGVVTAKSTGTRTAVVYFRANSELHVLAMTDAEAEVVDFLASAKAAGTLNVLWVTPTGDQRLSLLQFDGCLTRLLRDVRRAGATDVLSVMYAAMEAVHYALQPHVLHRLGIDPSSVRRSVVHYVATRTMLDAAKEFASPMSATKH